MKQFFALITLLLVLANGMAGQTQKTLVKTLALEPTTTSLQFDIPAMVEVQEWEENTIRIITTVDVNVGENILKDTSIIERLKNTDIPILLLINKIDKANQQQLDKAIKHWEKELPKAKIFPISLFFV